MFTDIEPKKKRLISVSQSLISCSRLVCCCMCYDCVKLLMEVFCCLLLLFLNVEDGWDEVVRFASFASFSSVLASYYGFACIVFVADVVACVV